MAELKLFIFDFDGTLVDSLPWLIRVINLLAEKHRFKKVDMDNLETLRHCDLRELMRMHGVRWWQVPTIARSARRMMAETREHIPIISGVDGLFEGLLAQGRMLGLVSSNNYENIARILGKRILSRISHVESEVSVFGKRRRLRRLLRKLKVSPSEAIYIGDEPRDLEAARAVGIHSGAVAWGYTSPETMRKNVPDYMFERISDILRLNIIAETGMQVSHGR